ncbi:MAG: SDR family NAD(P)-dependent oxidoreductase [Betaproteobacteria bacterium]
MPQNDTHRLRALVTGAAQGIGAALAVALAREGCDLALTSTCAAGLRKTVHEVESSGGRAIALSLDLSDVGSFENAMAQAVRTLGALDLLVNNAGITIRRAALDVTREDWDAIQDVNLKGAFFLSQWMGRHLVARGEGGSIINIASTHGLVGYPERSVYGIAKAGLIQMTRMLAVEWAPHGIRVNAIAPGTVNTPSRQSHFAADPKAREAIVSRVPLRRFATMEEVAAAVCYLARPESAYITGHTLILDGGLTAQ